MNMLKIKNGSLTPETVTLMKNFVRLLSPETFLSKAQAILVAEPEVSDDVLEELLLDEIDLWHSEIGSNPILPLHKFLGVTKEEYSQFIEVHNKEISEADLVREWCKR